MTGGPLLSVQAVAAQLGVSPKTIRGLVARGELVAHRVGACIRIAPAAVDVYLDATRVGVRGGDATRVGVRGGVASRPPSPARGRTGGLRAVFAAHEEGAAGEGEET